MRLSEAILLGSTVVNPMPRGVLEEIGGKFYGCAYGMAAYARGCRDEAVLFNAKTSAPYFTGFQWSKKKPADNPGLCKCNPICDPRLMLGDFRGYITHYFNNHVCGDHTMTLEQLCDWIRSIEPSDEPATAPEVAEREIVSVEP